MFNKGRAPMRLLGVNYRVVKKAGEIRTMLEDAGHGWELMTTASHRDAVDYSPLQRWAHGPEASTEDNYNKTQVRVIIDVEDGVNKYVIHYLRYLNGSLQQLRRTFLKSAEYADIANKYTENEKAKRRTKAEKIVRRREREHATSTAAGVAAMDMDQRPRQEKIEAEIADLTEAYKVKQAWVRARRGLGGKDLVQKKLNRKLNREPTEDEIEAVSEVRSRPLTWRRSPSTQSSFSP